MGVYNGEIYLTEAMDSVLQQTFSDFEFLIINDGSTDRTSEILHSYQDSRVRIISNEKNIDQARLREAVLDDLLEEKLLKWLEENNTVVMKKSKKKDERKKEITNKKESKSSKNKAKLDKNTPKP